MSQTIGSKPKGGAKAAKATGSKRAVSTKKARAAATPKSRTAAKSVRATRARQTSASAQHGHPAVSKQVSMARSAAGHNIGVWCKGPCGLVFGGLRHLLGCALSFIRPHIPK